MQLKKQFPNLTLLSHFKIRRSHYIVSGKKKKNIGEINRARVSNYHRVAFAPAECLLNADSSAVSNTPSNNSQRFET